MPKTPAIVTASRTYRAELLKGEAQASADMVRTYTALYEATRARLEPIAKEIAADIAAGKAPGAARVFEKGRLERIIAQTTQELARFSKGAETLITARQKELVGLAQEHAAGLGRVALGKVPAGFSGATWARVPTEELTDLAGISADGSPLSRILGQLTTAGVNQVRTLMLNGVAQGNTTTQIGHDLANRLGANLARSLTVMRTEDMRAYRMSQTRAYSQNTDVISGVTWLASLSFDTCPSCLMQHGKRFPPDYIMESHPNCRCVLVPITKSWSELGFPGFKGEPRQTIQTGADWFKKQDAAAQEKILGKAGFAAFVRHDVGLEHFNGYRENDQWGGMFYARSASAAIAAAKAAK